MNLQDVIEGVKCGEFSQAELAERSGVSKASVSQICNGINDPKHSNAVALIKAAEEIRAQRQKAA